MIFSCPLCGQKLQAADDAAGKRCRCTQCKSLVDVPAVPSSGSPNQLAQPRPVQRPVQPRSAQSSSVQPRPVHSGTPIPRPVAPPRNVLAEELESLIVERRQQARQQAAAYTEQMKEAERQQRALQAKALAGEQSGNRPAGLPVFVTVVLASCGVLALFCGGAAGLLYYKRMPVATVLQVGGFQATAHGKAADSRSDATTVAKGVLSPLTGSEFWIAAVQLSSAAPADIATLKSRFASAADTVAVVERGGIAGIKCTGISAAELGMFQDLQPEMEIFVVPNQLIFLTYVPGSHKKSAGLQPRALPEARERRYDNPERFFASFRRADQ